MENENEKVKPDVGGKNETNLLKLKVEFLEKENNSLKNEINSKQDLVGSILENYSDLLRHQCYYFKQHPETDQGNHGVRSNDKYGANNNF